MNYLLTKTLKYTLFLMMVGVLAGASCEHAAKTSENKSDVPPIGNEQHIAFYNVENLFDTSDDPKTMDEDFTPSGKLQWDEMRFKVKLGQLTKVFDALPGELPAFIGMCEIENRKVLEDLVAMPLFAGKYRIIHKDSPDERGIDVAAIYDSTRIKIDWFNYTTINLPNDADPYTRDILYAKAKLDDELIHFFVNHWPSRGGGQVETEKNRIAVANVLESLAGKIKSGDKDAKILIMGDFNDFPTDVSINKTLGAGPNPEDEFFNYMYDDCVAGKGSYFYKGAWDALDQFIGSWALKNSLRGWYARETAANIFTEDLVMFTDKEGNKRPNRTYIGEKYNEGGFSDHLPIYITLTRN